MNQAIIEQLIVRNDTKIVMLIMDGLGGCPMRPGGRTELQSARKPNLDALAAASDCGLIDPVYPGVTPGSGPAHLALFGYDPVEGNIGRGLLSALGVNFRLEPGDVAARVNFATADGNGLITDRRAGRISTEENRRICLKLGEKVRLASGARWFIEPEKEHRAVLVLRGEGLDDALADTDPQVTGKKALAPAALRPEAERTASILAEFLAKADRALADEPRANALLLRGFSGHRRYPTMAERFGLRCLALAVYPMYKGLARLVGMDVHEGAADLGGTLAALEAGYGKYDFFFVHYKTTDSRGEDGDFHGKVRAIEEVDAALPAIIALKPDVLAVTGDHSTPALLKGHSWHPVPLLVHSPFARAGGAVTFDEAACSSGSLGRLPSVQLMGLLLACALRLKKFGA